MKQFTKLIFAAIILCGTATMLTSCLFEDNPSTPSRPIPEGADSKDYQCGAPCDLQDDGGDYQ